MMMDDDYDRRRHNAFEGCQRDTTIAYDGQRRTTNNEYIDYKERRLRQKNYSLQALRASFS
ncbi:hypothetical protein DPMN_117366 [Dreissena polymorpha]|uniref:Uncharacterized protein n=1 Tax=Dreissena polymorpha TaxID=45954 RepID=A0A9D4KQC8_DREPO|nr:hypothetical protein DPMN_117366 [Dreissena polymorpha]